jgi:thymidylate synthase ThyX
VIANAYKRIIELGGNIEDARGILPTNILTNIVMKINMRNYVELVRKRSSSRTQDEYRDVLDQMKLEVARKHPWIALFTGRTFDQAANELDTLIRNTLPPDKDPGGTKTTMIKLIDQMRAKS